MRVGGGKSKGSSFERLICVQLSNWVSNGAQDDVFWRSAVSGGRSTVAAAKGRRLASQAGDISCIHESGMKFAASYLIECKNYKNLDLSGLVTGKGHLIEFWSRTKKEASRCEKLPLLIAKQNRLPVVAILSVTGLRSLGLTPHLMIPAHDLYMVLWSNFLKSAIRP